MVKNWKFIQIVIIFTLTLITFLLQPSVEDIIVPHITINTLFIAPLFSFFSIIFTIWIQSINKRQNVNQWKKISWHINPFSIKQPILFFNFVGKAMFFSYIPSTINTCIKYEEYCMDGIFLLLLGLSIIIASYFSSFLFIKKSI